jgi:hypothetical protein
VAMRHADVEKIFNTIKPTLIQSLTNFYLEKTNRVALAYLDFLLVQNTSEPKDLVTLLESYSYKDF